LACDQVEACSSPAPAAQTLLRDDGGVGMHLLLEFVRRLFQLLVQERLFHGLAAVVEDRNDGGQLSMLR
jgi:hypothetical protein